MATIRDLVESQIAYYDDRTPTYDDWLMRRGAFDRGFQENSEWLAERDMVIEAISSVKIVGHVVDIACGTAWWTQYLPSTVREVTLLDSSESMLRIAEARLTGKFQVNSICQDVFSWLPGQLYDGALCTFWLSHVPNELLCKFLDSLRLALKPGALVFVADHKSGGLDRHPEEMSEGTTSTTEPVIRHLDAKRYEIIKEIRTPASICAQFREYGLVGALQQTTSNFVFGAFHYSS